MILPLLVRSMKGFGDNIFQRAFVKSLIAQGDEVYITTPWPEVYEDLAVKFLHDPTSLRTQAKNLAAQPTQRWAPWPKYSRWLRVQYGRGFQQGQTVVGAMQACFRVAPGTWDLPAYESPVKSAKPIAVVRPVTERKEWLNAARNPLPEYVDYVARDLCERGYHVVSVADLAPGAEWLVGEAPAAHVRFHAGELGARELIGLIQAARVVVGGVGWIVPACIATRTPLFCILGGQGGHNAPSKITDSRMDTSHVGFATPDHFCHCVNMRHDCTKQNSRLADQWRDWRQQRGL